LATVTLGNPLSVIFGDSPVQGIAEAVAELLRGQRDGVDPHRRGWLIDDARDRCSIQRHRRRGDVLPEQPLNDETSEGMADDDWLRFEGASDPGVVLDDLVDAVPSTRAGCS